MRDSRRFVCASHIFINPTMYTKQKTHKYIYIANYVLSTNMFGDEIAGVYGVATIGRLLKTLSLFCKRAL